MSSNFLLFSGRIFDIVSHHQILRSLALNMGSYIGGGGGGGRNPHWLYQILKSPACLGLNGQELKFNLDKEMGELNGCKCISFNKNKRLRRIYETICEAIKCRNLNLKFEYKPEMWVFDTKQDTQCDKNEGKFPKSKDSGLLIYDYQRCHHVDSNCLQYGSAMISLKINKNKIECTELKW